MEELVKCCNATLDVCGKHCVEVKRQLFYVAVTCLALGSLQLKYDARGRTNKDIGIDHD